MSELEKVGLIERMKQGQGKPTIIYVKKFVSDVRPSNPKNENGDTFCPNMQNDSQRNHDFPKAEIQTSEKGKSRLPECGSADFRKADTNNTEYNNNKSNDTYPIQSHPEKAAQAAMHMDGWDADEILSNSSARPSNAHVDQCRREIRRRIDYYELIEPSQEIEDQVDEMVELMVETICSTSPTIRVAGDEYPAELVKARFEKITASHIDYVMECLRKNTTHIRNIKKYLLTALFNAPVTAKHFENAEFNHFYRGGGV